MEEMAAKGEHWTQRGVHETSVAIRRKSDVQVHIRANKESETEMGPWNVGWRGAMTDEHIILTENGDQKARSLQRVPPEERFVISVLRKVRGTAGRKT